MMDESDGTRELKEALRGVQIALESRPKQHPWSLYYQNDFDDMSDTSIDEKWGIDIETIHQLLYVVAEREDVDVTKYWHLHGPRIHNAPGSMVEYFRWFEAPLRQIQLAEFGDYGNSSSKLRSGSGGVSTIGDTNHYAEICSRVLDDAPALGDNSAFTTWLLAEHAPADLAGLYEQLLRVKEAKLELEVWLEELIDDARFMRFTSGDIDSQRGDFRVYGAPDRLADAIELMYARLSTHPRLPEVRSPEQYWRHVKRFEDLEKLLRNTLGSVEAEFDSVENQDAATDAVKLFWKLFIEQLWPPIGYLVSIDTADGPDAQSVIDKQDENLSGVEIVSGESDDFHEGVTQLVRYLDSADLA